MGKIIVTSGNYSKTPYFLKNSKLSIHSMEELSFCILKNPELCEDFLYDRDLATFIDKNLGLKERANLLLNCIERDAPLKDFVIICFCSCDYLIREEIEDFVSELSKVERTEKGLKIKHKADSYLELENYKNAGIHYQRLIDDAEILKVSPETLGDIYHNMGISVINTEGMAAASDFFRKAYELNNREESLQSYLLTLKFSNNEEELKTAMDIYGDDTDLNVWLNNALYSTELEAEAGSELHELNRARKLLEEGKVSEFYNEVGHLTEKMKEEYRRFNE